MEKQEMRVTMRRMLKTLNLAYLLDQSSLACERLIKTSEWQEASSVTCYCSMTFEFQTRKLLEAAFASKKRVFLPKVMSDRHMLMLEATSMADVDSWPQNKWGIPEPPLGREEPQELSLVVVPGLAFDATCKRLGQGAGFYDTWLAALKTRPPVVALALDEQLVRGVPHDDHDVPVDVVLTPSYRYDKPHLPVR